MSAFDLEALVGFQDDAASLFTDTFTAYRPNGTTRDASGVEVPAYVPVGQTPGKIQGRASGLGGDTKVQSVNIGGVGRLVIIGGLHIPIDSPAPALGGKGLGWEYVLTSPGPFTPPELVGSRWLVVDSPAKTYMTARRLDVVRLP